MREWIQLELELTQLWDIHATSIATYVSCTFEPQKDITAFELAKLLPHFHGAPMTEYVWNNLDPNIRRHLRRIK